eukprot:m.12232 g.12232  ORF g.12232 m.12232 type:complete len:55 (+) comp7686_c0_seq1:525-689(+)
MLSRCAGHPCHTRPGCVNLNVDVDRVLPYIAFIMDFTGATIASVVCARLLALTK